MNLEQKVRQKVIVRKATSNEVVTQIRDGSKFIIVDDSFHQSQIPRGFTLINVRYREDSFKTLVPQATLFFVAEPGENDPGEALDEVADFYRDIKFFEDDMIERGDTSVQGANWASTARESYRTYLINVLVKGNEDDNDPEFDKETLKRLDLDDPFVRDRVKVMAGLILGKSKDEISTYDVKDVLRHYSKSDSVIKGETLDITNEEFRKITKMRYVPRHDAHTKNMRCLGDSHYYLLPEYENNKDWDYDLRTMTKTAKRHDWEANIAQIEEDIMKYRENKNGKEAGRHDMALIRMYANIAHIAKDNPRAQLDVMPAIKESNNERHS